MNERVFFRGVAAQERPRAGGHGPACRASLVALALCLAAANCSPLSTEAPGALVPPTADQDAALPQLRVQVAGSSRALHLRLIGRAENPVLLAIPGGPGGDFRLLLPLAALADRYHLVLWDPRGAGLSERVPAPELTLESLPEEVAAVHTAVAPGRRATLLGHSEGALVMLRYAIAHPEAVEQLVMIEPGPISPAARSHYGGGWIGFSDAEDFFWQNEILTSTDHAAADYKAIALLPAAARTFNCTGEAEPYPTWRFGAFRHHVLTHTAQAPRGAFDWADGFARFGGEVLLLAGACGAAGEAFQRAHNLPSLPGARLQAVTDAGHMSLFTDFAPQTLATLRDFLAAYRDPPADSQEMER